MDSDFEIREGLAEVDFARVSAWLAGTYWSPGVSREVVERAAAGSALVVSAHGASGQAGYCRAVSDCATLAWVCDVYVEEGSRGRGIAREMVRFARGHPRLQAGVAPVGAGDAGRPPGVPRRGVRAAADADADAGAMDGLRAGTRRLHLLRAAWRFGVATEVATPKDASQRGARYPTRPASMES